MRCCYYALSDISHSKVHGVCRLKVRPIVRTSALAPGAKI